MRGSMQSLSIAKQMKLTNKLFEVPVERGGAAVVCSMGSRCSAAWRDICAGQHLQGEKTREIEFKHQLGFGRNRAGSNVYVYLAFGVWQGVDDAFHVEVEVVKLPPSCPWCHTSSTAASRPLALARQSPVAVAPRMLGAPVPGEPEEHHSRAGRSLGLYAVAREE